MIGARTKVNHGAAFFLLRLAILTVVSCPSLLCSGCFWAPVTLSSLDGDDRARLPSQTPIVGGRASLFSTGYWLLLLGLGA